MIPINIISLKKMGNNTVNATQLPNSWLVEKD
jgi:hypothetical protein